MTITGNIIKRFQTIINIGVTPDASPDETKYFQMVNLFVFVAVVILGAFMLIRLIKGNLFIASFEFVTILLLLLTLVFNKMGRNKLAKAYIVILLCLFLMTICVAVGEPSSAHYWFYVTGMFSLGFPKKERNLLILLMVFTFACYNFTTLVLYEHIKPLNVNSSDLKIYTEYGVYLAVVLFALVARHSILHAEDLLTEEQEKLKESNERISRLTEKLKVYLPHQFVESLAQGDRDIVPDYRRRRLTIFFSDVQGFTRWTDKLEPEETREILNEYLSAMSDIAHEWGGTIDKFIGDAVMIFFGDPEFTSDKDHALRAAKMALDMQDMMFKLREKWEDQGYLEPLRIRIGINTGYATVGNFGSDNRLNYTALGSSVNLASRLESACRPDCITISHTTYALIKGDIVCESKGEIDVKGFSEPIKIYEITGIKSESAPEEK